MFLFTKKLHDETRLQDEIYSRQHISEIGDPLYFDRTELQIPHGLNFRKCLQHSHNLRIICSEIREL